ncbi:MAG: bifunctional methylenetetrahydrofolate dehydrogenase/methenyltetrahydrofolate cyclohydrolase [Alphaproteobacteria bacterium]|nr:bifunctional methylenetetrahydrofolate dehydrogenase/methenyltetrahydrofolate cyclohydrolase [Alphaproteobacteria bacterium]MCZ6496255.1 bifunctional methylenetetrahydrofolate dehydrogenase/methenyltetrahydrofolate cyclohydrolase [Alphaproteobacteria bacterium]
MSAPRTAKIIDGKGFAEGMRTRIGAAAARLKADYGLTPGLAVILVGEDPASVIYTRNKGRAAEAAGFASSNHRYNYRLPADTGEVALLDLIRRLNEDGSVHGILVQLPLPDHIDPHRVITAIDPAKDVDGFHLLNVGRLATGFKDGLVPCTPQGCIMLLKHALDDLTGLNALVLGRSNIVGKPMARLLLGENCTVTMAHSRTRDLAEECRQADILIVAVGRPRMVKGDWIKPGATVIDVGINRITAGDGKTWLVGDVDFDEAVKVAGHITPVPGGVGPMTIACLLRNTLIAAARQAGLPAPEI